MIRPRLLEYLCQEIFTMAYFTTERTFLVPSFDLPEKETGKLRRYLAFLEASGVGEVIARGVKNGTAAGGRPNCDYYRMFATVLYGFANDRYTLRKIAEACSYDIRYIFLMQQTQVDYSTISRFINKIVLPSAGEIFSLLCKRIKEELGVDFGDAFIDGTKFEANANKYKFVWKPTRFHERISARASEIIERHGLLEKPFCDRLMKSSAVAKAITNLEAKKADIAEPEFSNSLSALSSMLEKILEYESKEEICGEGRKSYYKTDHDATAMALKADYYSGLGSNMHAAYNVQALVIKGIVFAYVVTQSRADFPDFIPVLRAFRGNYGVYPERVCADSGYGNLENYSFLKENGIGNFVKCLSWEGNVTGRCPDCYEMADDGTIICLNGNVGRKVEIEQRHPKKAGAVFYRVDGCGECGFSKYCKRFMKDQSEGHKIFEIVPALQIAKQESTANLLSPKGIEMRVNRSIQSEGTFGIVKRDYGRERFNRRGMEKVSCETMLYFAGLNVAKLLRFYETGKQCQYWVAPPDLKPQEAKKPSAKKLSKKGARINAKTYKDR